jgi:hypothetical protein
VIVWLGVTPDPLIRRDAAEHFRNQKGGVMNKEVLYRRVVIFVAWMAGSLPFRPPARPSSRSGAEMAVIRYLVNDVDVALQCNKF